MRRFGASNAKWRPNGWRWLMPSAPQKYRPPSELGGLLCPERFQHLEQRILPSVISGPVGLVCF
jgi:hypothetical protein